MIQIMIIREKINCGFRSSCLLIITDSIFFDKKYPGII